MPPPAVSDRMSRRGLCLRKMLGERARSLLVPEDAYAVDRSLEDGLRERRHVRALDEKHGMLPGRELIHYLAHGELPLDGLLVIGFDDDPWSASHAAPPFHESLPGCRRSLRPR